MSAAFFVCNTHHTRSAAYHPDHAPGGTTSTANRGSGLPCVRKNAAIWFKVRWLAQAMHVFMIPENSVNMLCIQLHPKKSLSGVGKAHTLYMGVNLWT